MPPCTERSISAVVKSDPPPPHTPPPPWTTRRPNDAPPPPQAESAAKIPPPAAAPSATQTPRGTGLPRADPPPPGGNPAARFGRGPAAGLTPLQATAKGGAGEGEGTGGGKSDGHAARTGECASPGKVADTSLEADRVLFTHSISGCVKSLGEVLARCRPTFGQRDQSRSPQFSQRPVLYVSASVNRRAGDPPLMGTNRSIICPKSTLQPDGRGLG